MTVGGAFDDPRPSASASPQVNGHAVRFDDDDRGAPVDHLDDVEGSDGVPGLEGVAWRPSYDRESVARYLADVEAEKQRLLAEIRLAEARVEAAQTRCEASSAEREALLGSLLLAARAEIDRVDAEHRATVTAISTMAEQESARIRDRAQAHAAAVRDVGVSLTETGDPIPASRRDRTGSADDGEWDHVS